jgi:hypothetical protein
MARREMRDSGPPPFRATGNARAYGRRPLWVCAGHVGDISRYLLMVLSGHDAIAGVDLKSAQIRWLTRDYSGLRGENLFCSFAPSANAIKCD